MTRTCNSQLGGRAYDTVGISQHLRSTPGGPSVLHRDPLPPFNPFYYLSQRFFSPSSLKCSERNGAQRESRPGKKVTMVHKLYDFKISSTFIVIYPTIEQQLHWGYFRSQDNGQRFQIRHECFNIQINVTKM